MMRVNWRLPAAAIGAGAIMAVIYKVFEFVVNDGQNLIWNDIFHSDTHRWVVVPLAVGLSILFGLVLIACRAPRWINPETDLLATLQGGRGKTTVGDVLRGLGIGGASLLAGAPLGPEMPLTESSVGVGKWAGGYLKLEPASAAILVIASFGALMVAFLGSLVMTALPFMLIFKQNSQLLKRAAAPIILSCFSAYGALWVMDHKTQGYGTIPAAPHADFQDYWETVLAALAVSLFAFLLVRLIGRLADLGKKIDSQWTWYAAAAIFGLVIGLLYWLGGQSVQFSGSAGTKLLVSNAAHYSTWAFLGLAAVKLLGIAWAKASGYRGGPYFPSIYASAALALFVESLFHSSGPGVLIGAIAAIFAALTFPDKPAVTGKEYATAMVFAFLIILALVPFSLFLLCLIAVLAAAAGNLALSKTMLAKR